jgi:diguanylate cyclase (GGDEF)-like protein
LFNRRRFDQQLSEEMSRTIRYDVPVSLLLLDIDHFKRLNDTHGHQFGDEVLRIVGVTLKAVLRQTDFAARYGGEEFAVILPHTHLTGGRQTAERLRSAVADLALPLERETVGVTVSIGLSSVAGEAARGDELIRQADHALYEAKKAGRDRVLTYSPKNV